MTTRYQDSWPQKCTSNWLQDPKVRMFSWSTYKQIPENHMDHLGGLWILILQYLLHWPRSRSNNANHDNNCESVLCPKPVIFTKFSLRKDFKFLVLDIFFNVSSVAIAFINEPTCFKPNATISYHFLNPKSVPACYKSAKIKTDQNCPLLRSLNLHWPRSSLNVANHKNNCKSVLCPEPCQETEAVGLEYF